MKILVMGAGAVGGYFGAVFHKAGHEVTLVARGEHLEAIQQRGLRVESVAAGNFTAHPSAVGRPDGSWKADLALFCVKAYDNPGAITTMAPAIGPGTSILTLQNGIGSGGELAAAFGGEKVLPGVTYIDAEKRGPGFIAELDGEADIIFGEEDGSRSPRAIAVLDTLKVTGINADLSSDIQKAVWSKLVFVCALSGVTCITNGSLAEVVETPETLELMGRVMREAVAVANAKGVELEEDLVERSVAEIQDNKDTLVSSMKADLDNGRPLEVRALNGAVAAMGKELGVETPVNELINACLSVPLNRGMSARRSTGEES